MPWLGITLGKFHDRRRRYGKVNEHNGWIPRDWWLDDWEKQAIIRFSFEYPLKAAGRIGRSTSKPSKKGTSFHQPQKAHEHWHIDISYINIHGTFYYLTTILDGYSRYIAPADKLAGREAEIFAARDRKPAEARERGKEQREAARSRTVA